MSLRTERWPAGVPCWADLTVPDVDAARAFYAQVLGWTFQATDPAYGGYTIAEAPGVPGSATAGIGPLPADGVPAWTLYLASDDADKTAAAVTENGGTLLVPPGGVGPMGRMFIAADPTGATFGVWEAGEHIGATVVNQPGALAWEDLRSPDPDAARAFYLALFGYVTQNLPMAGPDYSTFSLPSQPEVPLGGMGGLMGQNSMPAHWLVYFNVADVPAAVTAATAADGTVIMDPFDSPYGKMAGLVDPFGALFWIVDTSTAARPDPRES